jgi:uncharacterized protein YbbK (DUF523 family)
VLLAYHPHLVAALREPSLEDPWRLLVSGCIAGQRCGVDGTDYGKGAENAAFLALPRIRVVPFCPEAHLLGVPRNTPDLHGGDGVDVLAARARVLDEHGTDISAPMIAGAEAMVALARQERVDLVLLTDASAACGSQVINLGSRFVEPRVRQKGVGVATAALLAAGFHVVSPRDFRTLGLLRARCDPGSSVDPAARDHQDHPWTVENLPDPHPRA